MTSVNSYSTRYSYNSGFKSVMKRPPHPIGNHAGRDLVGSYTTQVAFAC